MAVFGKNDTAAKKPANISFWVITRTPYAIPCGVTKKQPGCTPDCSFCLVPTPHFDDFRPIRFVLLKFFFDLTFEFVI